MKENKFYTIKREYFEKKNSYCYILQLNKKISPDHLNNLQEHLKIMNGFYFSFKKESGFVFKYKREAKAFGDILEGYLYSIGFEEDEDANDEENIYCGSYMDDPEILDYLEETFSQEKGDRTNPNNVLSETKEEDITDFSNRETDEADSNNEIISILKENFIIVETKGKYGIINCLGDEIFPKAYDKLYTTGSEKVLFTQLEDKYGLINLCTKLEVTPQYDQIDLYNCNLALVRKNNLYGFIDEKGKEIIPCQYHEAESFSEDRAVVKKTKKGKKFVIDKKGKSITPPIYADIGFFLHGRAHVTIDDWTYGFIDLKGKLVIPIKYNLAERPSFLCEYGVEKEWIGETSFERVVDLDGNIVFSVDGEYSWWVSTTYEYKGQKRIIFRRSENETDNTFCGATDIYGNEKIPFGFTSITLNNPTNKEDSCLCVEVDNKYNGCLSLDGEMLIDTISEELTYLRDGYAIIKQKRKYGVMKPGSEWVIPCIYYSITQLDKASDGTVRFIVSKGKKWGVLNDREEWILPCQFENIEVGFDGQFILGVKKKKKIVTDKMKDIGNYLWEGIYPIANADSYLCIEAGTAHVIDKKGLEITSFSCEGFISILDNYECYPDNEEEETGEEEDLD